MSHTDHDESEPSPESRDTMLRVRCTRSMVEDIDTLADQRGLTRSGYVRRAIRRALRADATATTMLLMRRQEIE